MILYGGYGGIVALFTMFSTCVGDYTNIVGLFAAMTELYGGIASMYGGIRQTLNVYKTANEYVPDVKDCTRKQVYGGYGRYIFHTKLYYSLINIIGDAFRCIYGSAWMQKGSISSISSIYPIGVCQ